MSSLIQFPFVRLSRALIDNPLYIQDITAADQQILDAITAIAGLGPNDFYIFGGLTYQVAVSGPNYYLPGTFYLKGTWYYMPSDFDEGLYLAPDITGIMPYTFSDAVTDPIYDVNYAQQSTSPTGNTPLFTGNMNQYRLDLKSILNQISILQLATALQNVQIATLPASYTVTFTNDMAIFFAAAGVNTTIGFSFIGAIPGTVVTLKWTFLSTQTLSIPDTAGQTHLFESGTLSNASNNINTLTMLYVGINEQNLPEVRIVLSQPTT